MATFRCEVVIELTERFIRKVESVQGFSDFEICLYVQANKHLSLRAIEQLSLFAAVITSSGFWFMLALVFIRAAYRRSAQPIQIA